MKEHPEDLIYKIKTFINELQAVQETYFVELVKKLNLNTKGEDYLFDYIYNSSNEYEDFENYLQTYKQRFNVLHK